MTRPEQRLTLAVWRLMMPLPEGVPVPEDHARRFLEDFLAVAPWTGRIALRAAIWLIVLAPMILGFWRPLHRLSPARAEQALDRLLYSNLYLVRQSCYLVRLQASMAYLGDLSTQVSLGYRSLPWVARGQRTPNYAPGELEDLGIAPGKGGGAP